MRGSLSDTILLCHRTANDISSAFVDGVSDVLGGFMVGVFVVVVRCSPSHTRCWSFLDSSMSFFASSHSSGMLKPYDLMNSGMSL